MLRSWFSKKPKPLTGAPAVRRMKTYSAQSGYVYQYFHEGQRQYSTGDESGLEFVFSISADRKTWRPLSVTLSEADLLAWQEAHDHELSSTERYAVAKMALFQALDERPTPADMTQTVRVRPADVDAIAETLGW